MARVDSEREGTRDCVDEVRGSEECKRVLEWGWRYGEGEAWKDGVSVEGRGGSGGGDEGIVVTDGPCRAEQVDWGCVSSCVLFCVVLECESWEMDGAMECSVVFPVLAWYGCVSE